jgi:hypothetical protein
MKTCDIIEGLTILEKYRERADGYNTGAEHDQIFAYATEKPVSEDDLRRLVELEWFQPDVDCGEDDFTVNNYDPEEGWSCLV